MNRVISFSHIGDYYIPIQYVLKKITKADIIIPEINNERTLSIGLKYSPNDTNMPFKYSLGNYIDALNKGTNVLIQWHQDEYIGELQQEILEELGYNFTFVNPMKNNHISIIKLYQFAKTINNKLNIISFIYYLIQGIMMIIFIDKLASYKRINAPKTINLELFNIQEKKLKKAYSRDKLNFYKIIKTYLKYRNQYKKIPLNNRDNTKILLIGEPYLLIDNKILEEKLLDDGISIYRYIDLTYLLFKKVFMQSKRLLQAKKYLKYNLGENATESIAYAVKHAKNGIDGIIHIKSYDCVSELSAIHILNKISEDYHIPILYLSLDDKSNIDMKLEAFCDMIKNRNQKF